VTTIFANLIAVQEIGFIKILRAASYDGVTDAGFKGKFDRIVFDLKPTIPLFARPRVLLMGIPGWCVWNSISR